jgi:hypothetical protein
MSDTAWRGEKPLLLLRSVLSIIPVLNLTKEAKKTLVYNGFCEVLAMTADRLFKTITTTVRLALPPRGLTGLAGVSTRLPWGAPAPLTFFPLCA